MIKGLRIHVHGRLAGLTRRRLAKLLARHGARLAGGAGAADLLVVAHARARLWPVDALRSATSPLVSELALGRILGLRPPLPAQARPFALPDVARLAGLEPPVVRDLAAFDVLEQEDGRFAFPEVGRARHLASLLANGMALGPVLEAGAALADRGRRLDPAVLRQAPWGGLMAVENDRWSTLDGQLSLDLGEPSLRYDEIFDIAEECEMEGDLAEAERLYRLAALLEPGDGTALFNLGNVLASRDRPDEALAAYHGAARRDRSIAADCHYNAAILCRTRGRLAEAEALYRAALASDPSHADARHNLALMLGSQGRHGEALALWDSLAREGSGAARRRARLCRIALAGEASLFG